MDEGEFRVQLDALGRNYAECVKDMNSTNSPNVKKVHRRKMQAVLDEISALERRHRGSWEQRLADKQAEGAHGDVIAYCVKQLNQQQPLIVEDPVIEFGDGRQLLRESGEAPPLSWLDYHDQVFAEWVESEKRFSDVAYPDAERPIKAPNIEEIFSARLMWATIVAVVLFVATLYLWA